MNNYKLSELIKIKNGCDYKKLNKGSVPVYGTGGIMTYVDKWLYDGESVLLPRKGSLDNILYVNGKFWTVDTMYWTEINTEKVYPRYLYYYLSLLDLSCRDTGSTLPSMTFDAYYELEVMLPNKEEQKKVLDILVPIEEKIKVNSQINDNLQNQMQTLYDYWFVQFDFPNKDGKPYKSSGGKMVWNETLRQNIPEAWTTRKLSSIINISNERMSPSEIKDRVYAPIEVIPRKRISFYETADTSKATTGLCPFAAKAILLSNRRVYFHKVCISPFDGVTRDTVIIITPNEESNLGFVFETVFSEHFINYATKNSYGSEQPVLSPTAVMDYVIAYPNDFLDYSYSTIVNEMIDQVLMNEKENKQLLELRNLLLPLLMTGQATIE